MSFISSILYFVVIASLSFNNTLTYSRTNDLTNRADFSKPLSMALETAEERAKEYCYQLMANRYFDIPFVLGDINLNNSGWSGKDTNIQTQAKMLLDLIDLLCTKNDASAKLLLQRFNKFFVFKMHRLLAENDLRHEQSVRMIDCLDSLYSFKIATPTGAVAPFRTLVSKTYIVLAMVNDGDPNFNSRKETMIWHMNKLKHEYLAVNRELGEQKIDDLIIKDFITLLAVYETRQPIIQPNRLKEIMIKALIVGAICVIVYWLREPLNKYVVQPIKKKLNDGIASLGEGIGKAAKEAGKGVAQGFTEEIQANKEAVQEAFKQTAAEAGAGVVKEVTKEFQANKQALQEAVKQTVAESMTAAFDRVTTERVPVPVTPAVPDGMATRGQNLGTVVGAGASEAVNKVMRENADSLQAAVVAAVTEALNKALPNAIDTINNERVPLPAPAPQSPDGMATRASILGAGLGGGVATGLSKELTTPIPDSRAGLKAGETTLGKQLGDTLGSGLGDGIQKELTKPKTKADLPRPNADETTAAKELGGQIGGELVGVLQKELTHPILRASIPTRTPEQTTILERLGEDFIGGVENNAAGLGKALVKEAQPVLDSVNKLVPAITGAQEQLRQSTRNAASDLVTGAGAGVIMAPVTVPVEIGKRIYKAFAGEPAPAAEVAIAEDMTLDARVTANVPAPATQAVSVRMPPVTNAPAPAPAPVIVPVIVPDPDITPLATKPAKTKASTITPTEELPAASPILQSPAQPAGRGGTRRGRKSTAQTDHTHNPEAPAPVPTARVTRSKTQPSTTTKPSTTDNKSSSVKHVAAPAPAPAVVTPSKSQFSTVAIATPPPVASSPLFAQSTPAEPAHALPATPAAAHDNTPQQESISTGRASAPPTTPQDQSWTAYFKNPLSWFRAG